MALTLVALLWSASAAAGPLDPPGLRIPHVTPTALEARLTLDPGADRFAGVARVHLDLHRKHKVIWLNAVDLDVSEATLWTEGQRLPLAVLDGDDQHLGFRPDKPVKGEVVVEIAYTGGVLEEAFGVFSQREAGDDYIVTQFEATDARRAFPCVDDPQHKLPWTLTLDVPDTDQAFTNTPPATSAVEHGRRVVEFATTQPLPSYLIAFAAGPYEAVDAGTAGRNDTPVRILVPRGRTGDAGWAARATGPILERLEDYFDQPYPYQKLDVIAVPHTVTFGAMEHPGLVTFRQEYLIVRPEDETEAFRRFFAEVQAHELGHQWFGNLVTPMWWDDIWLNESFASWIGAKVVAQQWPEWKTGTERVRSRDAAMQLDGLASARRVREPVDEADDIATAFDGITYKKGQSVLEMTERWLGDDTFREGVRRYIREHAHGNATAVDFLDALGAAARRDVSTPVRTFLDQPGVPLVTMTLDCEAPPAVELTQERLVSSGETDASLWQVPVCVRHDAGTDCALLTRRSHRLELSAETCPTTLVPNDDYVGYYRSDVGEAHTAALLQDGSASPEESVGVLFDAVALIGVGRLPPTLLLDQAETLAASDSPVVAGAAGQIVGSLSDRLVADDQRGTYAAFVQRTFGDQARALGFDPEPGESEETAKLRRTLLVLVGDSGEDEAIAAEARERAERWLATRDGTDPSLVPSVLQLAAVYGDRALFDAMSAAALVEENREHRGLLIDALGYFRDPDVVPAVLELSSDESLNLRERAPLLFGPASRARTQQDTWAFITSNIEAIEDSVPGVARGYIIYLAAGFCSDDGRAETEAFFAERARRYLGGKRILASTLEQIEVCSAGLARQAPDVRAFLEAEAARQAAEAEPADVDTFEASGEAAGGPAPGP